MSPQDAFPLQLLAFHAAILDNCDRAARSGQTDEIALRLRNNALALGRLQLAMLTLCGTAAADPAPALQPEPQAALLPPGQDHLLSGDALSRFASRRLEADESPHDVWQLVQEAEPKPRPAKRRRNPALPNPGFRSSSG